MGKIKKKKSYGCEKVFYFFFFFSLPDNFLFLIILAKVALAKKKLFAKEGVGNQGITNFLNFFLRENKG